MALEGGCRCRAIRYEARGEPTHSSLCHCEDCRRSAGAPVVAWAAFRTADLRVTGTPAEWSAGGGALRRFCGTCGTGLFYLNEAMLPGLTDIQIATLDDPEALPPQAHIQAAERLGWMAGADALPAFDRYPG